MDQREQTPDKREMGEDEPTLPCEQNADELKQVPFLSISSVASSSSKPPSLIVYDNECIHRFMCDPHEAKMVSSDNVSVSI